MSTSAHIVPLVDGSSHPVHRAEAWVVRNTQTGQIAAIAQTHHEALSVQTDLTRSSHVLHIVKAA